MALIRGAPWWLGVFAGGLIVRIVLILLASPWTHEAWFAPFLEHFSAQPSLDPWTDFLRSGGDPLSFPYGPVYLVSLSPFVWLGGVVFGQAGSLLALKIGVLAFDVALLYVIRRLAPAGRTDVAALFYWLSPITFYVNYWHGQLDVVPTLVLAISLLFLRERRFAAAGAGFALAIAAKFSMALAVPFVAIYLLGSGRFSRARYEVALTFLAVVSAVALVILSSGFREMVLSTPEVGRLYAFAIPVQPDIQLYALPVALLAFLYTLWRMRRVSFDMLVSGLGAGFFSLILLTQPAPGWAVWALPFLVLHVARYGRSAQALAVLFSLLFAVFHLVSSTGATVLSDVDLTQPMLVGAVELGADAKSLIYSLYFLVGFALLLQMVWRGVFRDPFYLATRKPLVIGIAGDSGVGKDTLADAISGLFGETAVSRISGDDYHNWDRNKPMWKSMTHLNPRSNDLRQFDADVAALAAGEQIRFRHYDHTVGARIEPMTTPPREIVIASGLHALHNPAICQLYDLSIYLDMDEGLRRHFKIQRDVNVRGHSLDKVLESIDRRVADGNRYISPQRDSASLSLSLVPARRLTSETSLSPDGLRLRATFRRGVDTDSLTRLLIALCGLDVSQLTLANGGAELLISGNPSVNDIRVAAQSLAPAFLDQLALQPEWQGGMTGIMQLIILRELSRVARKRVLSA